MPRDWCSFIADEDDAAFYACIEAARKNGVTREQAIECEDGAYLCPECPWMKPTKQKFTTDD